MNNRVMCYYVRSGLIEFKPNIVITLNVTGWSTAIWGEICARKIPIIHVLHDLYLLCPTSNMFKNGSPCVNVCSQCSLMRVGFGGKSNFVSAVVGVSKFILDKHVDGGLFLKSGKL